MTTNTTTTTTNNQIDNSNETISIHQVVESGNYDLFKVCIRCSILLTPKKSDQELVKIFCYQNF